MRYWILWIIIFVGFTECSTSRKSKANLDRLRNRKPKVDWRYCTEEFYYKLENDNYSLRTAKTYIRMLEKYINYYPSELSMGDLRRDSAGLFETEYILFIHNQEHHSMAYISKTLDAINLFKRKPSRYNPDDEVNQTYIILKVRVNGDNYDIFKIGGHTMTTANSKSILLASRVPDTLRLYEDKVPNNYCVIGGKTKIIKVKEEDYVRQLNVPATEVARVEFDLKFLGIHSTKNDNGFKKNFFVKETILEFQDQQYFTDEEGTVKIVLSTETLDWRGNEYGMIIKHPWTPPEPFFIGNPVPINLNLRFIYKGDVSH